ncbi:MAG: hypothetical protein HOY79_50220 [Streptomyces sp.]|nr:hypothetical protein [Streptomyces sp.]
MRRLVERHRTRLIGLVAAVPQAAAGSVTAATPSAQAAPAAVTASVSVDAGRTLASIPATGVGMNVAVYDGNMNHPSVPGLLKDAGVAMVRCPGGSYTDGYHWQTHIVEGGCVAPNTDFNTFMGTVRATGALINQYAGSNAPNVGIAVTEAHANAHKDTSPNGLFAPDEYLTWMENGASATAEPANADPANAANAAT